MAKFSLARQPYYVAVAAYMAVVFAACWWQNTVAVGTMSDVWLALMAVSGALSGWSVFYLLGLRQGADDEVGVEVAGIGIDKKFYYLGVLGIAAWRALVGFMMNHSGTGITSNLGMIWLVVSVVLAVFTWANYQSFKVHSAAPTIPAAFE